MALLKLYRGAAAPAAEVGKIWFDLTNGVIKVCNGTEWEAYGLSEAEIAALILAAKNEVLGTLEEGDSATLAALNDEIDALQAELAALAAKTVTINEKTTGHVTVSKTVDEKGATVYTVAENDIASAQGLANEIKRATDEEARIAGLVATEQGRAEDAEEALAGRLDVIEGEGEGSIKKAVADAKAELIGGATEAGNTLGKLEDRINDVAADAKTYSIAKVSEGLGENVKEAFKLVDEDGTQVGETINIYKDSSLISVELTDANAEGVAGQYIKYTYVLANGTESVQYVDVSRLLVEAEFKNGLEVSTAGEVSVKVDAASEAFLTVGADGVKLSGVADAIATAVAAEAEIARAAEKANADAIAAEVTRATAAEEAIAADLATLDAEVQEHEQVVSAALNDLNARMTTAEGSVADHETRLAQAEADIDALEGALANKNVVAESTTPDYVTATAADNKVTVAATQKVIDAVALAETSVQTITSANTCLTANKSGNNVELSLVWESGSFTE